MEEKLINYDTAVLAKDKGFDIPCLYGVMGKKMKLTHEEPYNLVNWNEPRKKFTSIPTQELLKNWLREKHNIYVIPYPHLDLPHKAWICRLHYLSPAKTKHFVKREVYPNWDRGVEESGTYYEALEKGLQEALKLV